VRVSEDEAQSAESTDFRRRYCDGSQVNCDGKSVGADVTGDSVGSDVTGKSVGVDEVGMCVGK